MLTATASLSAANDAAASPPPYGVAGQLTDKDLKRLVSQTRSSHIGPTALYYAGVTAPVISAGVALVTRAMIDSAGISQYWIVMISSIVAAMAGICWYLIFLRWSYRGGNGRGAELDSETAIDLLPTGLHIRRGAVETRIGWPAVSSVKDARRYTLITFRGADPLLIPDRWFGKDKAAAKAFKARLKEGFSSHGPQQEAQ